MNNFMMLLVILAAAACGSDSKKKSQPQDQDFRLVETNGEQVVDGFAYELAGDDCTTGFHGPTDLQSYCTLLLDEAANNNCAKQARLEVHTRDCGSK